MPDQASAVSGQTALNRPPPPSPPEQVAQRTVEANRTPRGLDVEGVRRDLDRIRLADPAGAAAVASEVERRLTPVERGQLAAATYSVGAVDGRPVTIGGDGQRVAGLRSAAPGTPARDLYDRLDRAYGDGRPQTDDTAAIDNGLRQAITGTPPAGQAQLAQGQGPDPVQLGLDLTQMVLDIAGIVDPTPISDGSNALVSAGRAIGSLFSGDFSGAGGHALNGVISVAGIVPVLGDAAKAGKIGKWAQTVADAVSAVAHNPALRGTFEPALRRIAEQVNRIPQGAIDALPAGARESLQRMKGQLDSFLNPAGRAADNVAGAIVDGANVGRTVRINGRDVVIGQAPVTARRAADNRPLATNAAGDQVALRQPGTRGTTRVDNPDGTVTYTRNDISVRYDANGFPLFATTRADLHLPPDKIVVGSRETHFTAANRQLAARTDDQLRGAGFTDADIAKLRAGDTPDGYTWHHHQDVGRMQLVRTSEHEALAGGHTGGWSLWGDGSRFTAN